MTQPPPGLRLERRYPLPGVIRLEFLSPGAVWRSRAPGRKPSASGRLDAAPEAAQNSMTCVRGTGSTRPWARDLRGIGPKLLPSAGGHLLGVPIPARSRRFNMEVVDSGHARCPREFSIAAGSKLPYVQLEGSSQWPR